MSPERASSSAARGPGGALGTADVAVVGGGLIGLCTALRLSQEGLSVTLLERSHPGAGASHAAAGMLAPQAEAEEPGPFLTLGLESRDAHAGLAAELFEETGIDVGYGVTGLLYVARDAAAARTLRERVRWQREQGLRADWLAPAEARRLEPFLGEAEGCAHFPDEARVDNGHLVRALSAAFEKAGGRVVTSTVERLLEASGRVRGVATTLGELSVGRVVLAAGAWSAGLTEAWLPPGAVRPIRGQMVAADAASAPALRHILYSDDGYVVPRADGEVLVGCTVEDVGFRGEVTEAGVAHVRAVGRRLCPALDRAPPQRSWWGFRPATADGLPLIGPTPLEGLVVATGHFRNGVLLTPLTARLATDCVLGRPPPESARGLSPLRLL